MRASDIVFGQFSTGATQTAVFTAPLSAARSARAKYITIKVGDRDWRKISYKEREIGREIEGYILLVQE